MTTTSTNAIAQRILALDNGNKELQLMDDPEVWEDYRTRFETEGYLVLEGYWSRAKCAALRGRMNALIQGFDLAAHRSVFSTDDQSRISDDYFLGSGDKIRFFWEADAFDKETGAFRQPRAASINKIGHALHDLDPNFQQVTYTPQIGKLARAVGGLSVPLVAQSMYIFEQPRIGRKAPAAAINHTAAAASNPGCRYTMAHQHQVNASGDDVIGLPITIEAGADSPPSDVGACSDENIGGGRKEGTASLWRPLRKALGVTSQARRHRSRDDKYGRNMAIPELDDDEGEDEEGLEEKNNGGDLSSSMVLDIDGNGDGTSAGGKKSPFRLPDYVQARSVHNLIPALISDEEEEGLELLAHAVAADNRAAEVEAAEAYAAAEGDGRNAGTRQPLLMGSLSETQRVSSGVKEEGQHSTSSTTTLTQENGNTTLSRSKALPTCPKAGRKVLTAKQQHVRTLTLPKQGQTMEMELALKDLLRYIQNAVRAVHVSQQQQFSINLSQNAYVPPFSTGGQCKEDSVSNAANSFNRKGMLHSRTMSTGNNESIMMGGGGPVTRMPLQAPPALVGGLLNARDVRRLVSGLDTESVKSKEMSIAVRRHTIVLSLDIIRCLILWDRIIVVVPDGAESNCFGELERNLRWLRVQQRAFDMGEGGEEEEEFEFLALEAVLMTINNHFRNRLKDIRPHIIKNSKALLGNGTLNTQLQDTLRQLKSQVANHQAKVRSLHKAIFALLDDEEHLQMLHLTRIITNNQNHQQQQQQHFFLQNGGLESVNTDAGMALGASEGKAGGGSRMGGRNSSVACGGDSGNGESNSNYEQQQLISTWLPLEAEDNDEAEILLESFLGDFNELIIKWELVKEDMQNTENYVTVKLDMARNKLLTIGTLFALVNLCFAFGALVSGIFGMNLYNGVSEGSGSEDSFPFFVGTISFIVFMMTVITGSVLAYMYMSRIIVT